MSGKQKLTVAIAVVAIIGALAMIFVYVRPTPPVELNAEIDQFLKQVHAAALDERYEQVAISTDEGRTKVIITGKAPRQADVDALRASIESITPKVPFEFTVTTGARPPR